MTNSLKDPTFMDAYKQRRIAIQDTQLDAFIAESIAYTQAQAEEIEPAPAEQTPVGEVEQGPKATPQDVPPVPGQEEAAAAQDEQARQEQLEFNKQNAPWFQDFLPDPGFALDAGIAILSPLLAFGDAGLAPIARPSQKEGFIDQVTDSAETSYNAFKKRLFADVGEKFPEYGQEIVESLIPDAPDQVKRFAGNTLDFFGGDPAIFVALPFAKLVQKGLTAARQKGITTRGILEEGAHTLFGVASPQRALEANELPSIPAPVATNVTPEVKQQFEAITKDPEFKEWFSGSVVSKDGAPKAVYHGTTKAYEEIELAPGRGPMVFFAEDPRLANNFANPENFRMSLDDIPNERPNVRPAYLNISKPLDTTTPEGYDDWLLAIGEAGVKPTSMDMEAARNGNVLATLDFNKDSIDILKHLGYDGYKGYEGDAPVWAVFDPATQIRSALAAPGPTSPVPRALPPELQTLKEEALKGLDEAQLIALAKRADQGDEAAIKALHDLVNTAPVKAYAEAVDNVDADEFVKKQHETIGDPEGPSFTVEELTPDDLLSPNNDIDRDYVVNINHAALKDEESFDNVLMNVVDAHVEKLEASLSPALKDTPEFAIDTKQQITDLVNMKVNEFEPMQMKALIRVLEDAGRASHRAAVKAKVSGSELDKLAAMRAVTFQLAVLEKVTGVGRHYGQGLSVLSTAAKEARAQKRQVAGVLDNIKDIDMDSGLWSMLRVGNTSSINKGLAKLGSNPAALAASSDPTTGNVLFEVFANSVLSGPITHAVNLTSNSFTLTMSPTESFFSSISAAARGNFKDSYVDAMEGVAKINGIVQGVGDVLALAFNTTQGARGAALLGNQFQKAGLTKTAGLMRGLSLQGKTTQQAGIPAQLFQGIDEGQMKHRVIIAENFDLPSKAERKQAAANTQQLKQAGSPQDAASIQNSFNQTGQATTQSLGRAGRAGSVIDYLGTYLIRVPGTALAAEDKAFKLIQYRMEVNAQAARTAYSVGSTSKGKRAVYNALRNNPDAETMQDAMDLAAYYTFTNKLGAAASSAHSAISHTPMRWAIPFFRTPTNIVKMGVRHSAVGNAFRDVMLGSKATSHQRDVANARIAMGTIVPITMLSLMSDNITGRVDKSTPEGKFKVDAGIPPYSVKLGDTWESYEKIEPLRSVLGLYANVRDTWNNLPSIDPKTGQPNHWEEQIMPLMVGPAIQTIGDTYMLQALGSVVQLLQGLASGNDEYSQKQYERVALGLTAPAFMRQINQKALDDTYRRSDNFLQKWQQAMLPGYSSTLPATKTLWGDDRLYPPGVGPDWISPVASIDREPTIVDKAIIDLQVVVPFTPKRMVIDGADIELNSVQQTRFEELRGKGFEGRPPLHKILKDMITDKEFKKIPHIDQRDKITKVINDASRDAKQYLYATDPDLQQKRDEYLENLYLQKFKTSEPGLMPSPDSIFPITRPER